MLRVLDPELLLMGTRWPQRGQIGGRGSSGGLPAEPSDGAEPGGIAEHASSFHESVHENVHDSK
jgi:hypothetical protein